MLHLMNYPLISCIHLDLRLTSLLPLARQVRIPQSHKCKDATRLPPKTWHRRSTPTEAAPHGFGLYEREDPDRTYSRQRAAGETYDT